MPRQRPLDRVKDKAPALAQRPEVAKKPTPKKREWDRRQREDPETTQVSYRGIPRELNRRMVEIAEAEGRSVSQVATLFLAVGLAAYDKGISLARMAENPGSLFDTTASGKTNPVKP
jgi:hypothetical protein